MGRKGVKLFLGRWIWLFVLSNIIISKRTSRRQFRSQHRMKIKMKDLVYKSLVKSTDGDKLEKERTGRKRGMFLRWNCSEISKILMQSFSARDGTHPKLSFLPTTHENANLFSGRRNRHLPFMGITAIHFSLKPLFRPTDQRPTTFYDAPRISYHPSDNSEPMGDSINLCRLGRLDYFGDSCQRCCAGLSIRDSLFHQFQ